ncbi:MAG: hypothetical protein KDD55_01680, partial [Bdellovibrionales bacterium]|nr:hypothetical protein [Bdellovibrionales bacterium]
QVLSFRSNPLEPPSRISRAANQTVRSLDPLLEEMYESAQAQLLHEELCVFYVALTRARHALYLFVQSKTSSSLSCATLLTSALPIERESGVIYQLGEPNWYLSLSGEKEESSLTRSEILQLQSLKERTRALSRKKPSELEGGEARDLSRELQPMSHQAALTGTVLHKLFERVTWIEDGVPSDEELFSSIASLSHDDEYLREQVGRFRGFLAEKEIASLFSREQYVAPDGRLMLYPEYSFVYREESHLVTGTIDRLVLWSDASGSRWAEIVDFKSDTLREENDLAEKVSFYQPQLEAYRQAVMHLYGLESSSVILKLAFVQHGTVHTFTL